MENQVYDSLKIENQICFPLYACSREIIKHYKPFLDELDLTYTQYIAMMVLWQYRSVTAKQLGKYLYLDSGTLTPMLKKMEAKGLLTRNRDPRDERNLVVTLTPAGEVLRARAVSVPERIAGCVKLEPEEAMALYAILYKILGQSRDE